MAEHTGDIVLSVKDLVVEASTSDGPVRIIDGVSFEVRRNEVLCLVGESGSGKSVTMSAVLGLLPKNLSITSGEILFGGRDLRTMGKKELRALRGRDMAAVFQNPMTSLNPVIRVGRQMTEMVHLHDHEASKKQARDRVTELLAQVGINNPSAASSYPHEFSGGMRQRAMIAMAATHSPDLLIADEPTTALDVTVQAQVLEKLRDMREETGSALVLVTHDLGVVAENADRVAVMYGGQVIETGGVEEIFHSPRHPYTVGLLGSLLDMESDIETAYAIPGQPPQPKDRGVGCRFQPRCALGAGRTDCIESTPPLAGSGPSHRSACWHSDETPAWIAENFSTVGRVS